jgi:hypothetical protein
LSDPKNVPQPPQAPPPRDPRELPEAFRDFPTLAACILMDHANAHLGDTVGRLVYLGQNELAGHYAGVVQHLVKIREDFYRQSLGGIIIAGPGDIPRG